MILADTSVWIEHFRRGSPAEFTRALERGDVLLHPFVLGELMLGGIQRRHADILWLRSLPPAPVALASEIVCLIEERALDGRGIGYVDAALLASALLSPSARLMTLDRRLREIAAEFGIAPHSKGSP